MEKKSEVLNRIEEIVWNISDNEQGVKEIYALFNEETERLQAESKAIRAEIEDLKDYIKSVEKYTTKIQNQ